MLWLECASWFTYSYHVASVSVHKTIHILDHNSNLLYNNDLFIINMEKLIQFEVNVLKLTIPLH